MVEDYLANIQQNKELNAFINVFSRDALDRASEIDRRRTNGEKIGKLAGIIIAVKDNICIKDYPVTCASRMLENFISPYNATVIEKILQEDGVIIGKTNLDEFGMGSSNENSYFGPVKNPINEKHVSGGSSGGSAVAVAKGVADIALGSDTGGSVRLPASFCGVVGLKPSYGRVSRYGLVAYASSLDQIGILGNSVGDVYYLFGIISGVDSKDATSVPLPVPKYWQSGEKDISKLRFGIPKEYFGAGLDPEIKESILSKAKKLESEGFVVEEVSLPLTEYAIACYYIIATAEASSNLARYDGVRYGYRSESHKNLGDMYTSTRSEGFGSEVKRRIMLGTYVLSAGYYDTYYRKAQQVRRLMKQQYDHMFKQVDILITPTSPTDAFGMGEKTGDPLKMYLSDIYTVIANLTGICAISLPCGKSKRGLPIGMQLMAGSFQEEKLFATASYIEESIK